MSLQGNLSVQGMCQLAQVSQASFYRSLQERTADNDEMEVRAAIQQIFVEHKRRYGHRRVTQELRRRGRWVNRKPGQRLNHEDNLLAVEPRGFRGTTYSNHCGKDYLKLTGTL